MRTIIKVHSIIDYYSLYPSIEKKKNRIIVRIKSPRKMWEIIDFSIVVNRVYPELVSEKLVSVQPMDLPSGEIFYLDYTYESVWRYNIISKQLVYVQKHNKDKNDRDIKIICELQLKSQT